MLDDSDKDLKVYKGYFDGGKRQNSIYIGYCIIDPDGSEIYTGSDIVGGTTLSSNVAEWVSLISLIQTSIDLGIKDICISGDSLLVVSQANRRYKAKSPAMKICLSIFDELIPYFDSIKIIWIPRLSNSRADSLTR